MKVCDVCGKTASELTELTHSHRVDEVKEICGECADIVRQQKVKLNQAAENITIGWFRAFLRSRKALASGKGAGNAQ